MTPEMMKQRMDEVTARYPSAIIAPVGEEGLGIFVDGYWEGTISWNTAEIEWRVPE